jgi:hypothetical protein
MLAADKGHVLDELEQTVHRFGISVSANGTPAPGAESEIRCTFRLVTVDGAPADPPSFTTVAPKWEPGDTIPLGRRTLARDPSSSSPASWAQASP